MKDLFVDISDVHISLKNLDVSTSTLRQALNKARDLRVPLFISGDLNDGKAIMRSEWVKALIDLFNEYSDVIIHVLIGNHDLDNKNAESNSLYFLKTLKNVVLHDRPGIQEFNGVKFGIIPYQVTNTEFLIELDKMKDKVENLIIHQGILGAFMGDYVVDESSVSPKEFNMFKFVGSGHYHKSQKMGENILYFGSPFTVNFGESNETKFIWIISELNGKIETRPILTEARRHYQIEWTKDSTGINAFNEAIPMGSLLKVVVRGTKEFVRAQTLDVLTSKFPQFSSISIVPEVDKQSENRISADIIHKPLKVIDAYLQNCVTDFNKDELRSFLLTLCGDVFTRYSSAGSKKFKIKSVEAFNFLSFKHLKFEYGPMGLTLIEGFDEDLGVNTGAGKSTFFDAPVYGIFGETSKSLKADEVLNRQVGKDLQIITTLIGEEGEFTIVRNRRHSQFENDLYLRTPNGQELRGKDNRETQKLIEQYIDCSFELFLKSTYFTQFGNIDRFLSASDTEQKKLISEITDLSIYDEMYEIIKKQVTSDEKQIETLAAKSNQLKYGIDTLHGRKESLLKSADEWVKAQTLRIQAMQNNIDLFESKKISEIDEMNSKLAKWDIDKSIRIHDLELLSSKWIEDQQVKIKDNETKIHMNNGHIAEEEFKINELKQIPVLNIVEEKKKIQDKLDIIRQLEDKIIRLRSSRDFIQSARIKLKNSIESELNKLANNLDSECGFCHQVVSGPSINKHIDCLKAELLVEDDKVSDLNSQIHKMEESTKIKTKLQEDMKALETKEKAQYEITYKLELLHRSIVTYKSQNESLARENSVVPSNPYSLRIESERTSINPYVAQIELVKAKFNPYYDEMKKLDDQKNPHQDGFTEIEVKMKEIEDEKNAVDLVRSTTDMKMKLGLWWKQAIHVYIKSYLMDSCLESINTIADEYLQTLFEGVLKFDISATTEKGSEVKEKIKVSITNNGDECSYQSLSGGERCRICLAVNFGVGEVTSKNFGFIQLDEIMNGLDESGKTQSMKLLKELERKYESIFVIDHAEGFKQLFNNSIMIKKKNKTSTIV